MIVLAIHGVTHMIEDISFVVVARNEEFAVNRCLRSILSMPLTNCEVIAVDSNSSDGTLDVMGQYARKSDMVSVFRCTGYVNSAVARNVGLDRASKKYICFCDGDTEWETDFLIRALNMMEAGDVDAVTGTLKEQIYSPTYDKILEVKLRTTFSRTRTLYWSGGNFIVRRAVANKVGRWDERLVRNQDVEYTLRISRLGKFMGIPDCMGTHHTLEYNDRIWKGLCRGWNRYDGFTLRNNLDRPMALSALVLRKNPGFLPGYLFYVLCAVAIGCCIFTSWPHGYVASLPFAFAGADLWLGMIRSKGILKRLLMHYFYPFFVLWGVVCGVPSKHEDSVIQKIE